MKIKNMDQEKLKRAQVHNLDSERSVGSVNYGLKIRGAKEIRVFSSSLVKAKSAKLMDGKAVTKEFKRIMKKEGAVPEILKACEKKQRDLKKQECRRKKSYTSLKTSRETLTWRRSSCRVAHSQSQKRFKSS